MVKRITRELKAPRAKPAIPSPAASRGTEGNAEPTSEELCNRIMPRIVPGRSAGLRSAPADFPRRALGFTGLVVIYEFAAGDATLKPVDRSTAEKLGLSDPKLHETALANLRAGFDTAVLAGPLRGEAAAVLEGPNAACLLLIPELLSDEQAVAAFIAGNGTLIVAPAPNDGDWGALKSIEAAKKSPYGPPLKVTQRGIEPLPKNGSPGSRHL